MPMDRQCECRRCVMQRWYRSKQYAAATGRPLPPRPEEDGMPPEDPECMCSRCVHERRRREHLPPLPRPARYTPMDLKALEKWPPEWGPPRPAGRNG